MKLEIEQRFAINVARVRNLITLYDSRAPATGQGRRTVEDTDLLRAGVVLLHASMEDVIRSVLEWKLPSAPPEKLKGTPLVGSVGEKFTMPDLAAHRGKTVDDVLAESVTASLLRSNYNHPGEVDDALERVGLPKALVDPVRDKLASAMSRRHWIVHRADRNEGKGSGYHAARPLQKRTVETWLGAVEQLGRSILGSC
jgi:hypothetical protein